MQALSPEISRLSHAKDELDPRGVAGLQISIRECGDVTLLDLRGRTINGGECELLSSNLEEVVANGVRKLLLNPTNLTQVDSSGITIIVATLVDSRSKGGELRLLCASGRVMEVFTLLRLLETIPSFEDEAQALASSGLPANTAGPVGGREIRSRR